MMRWTERGAMARAALLCAVTGWGGACEDSVSARMVGESAHFRLFVGNGTEAQRTFGGDTDGVLLGLETNWTDTWTLLAMPEDEGKIDYYLIDLDEIEDRCGEHTGGCQIGLAVYSNARIDQHELNHGYMVLRSAHQPAAVLVEGVAEAIGCDDGSAAPAPFTLTVDWPTMIATTRRQDVYGPGRQLVRYLILQHGIEPFLRYYEQAPDTHDPQVFADNFAAFWSTDIDTVWADMQIAQPAWGPTEVLPLCPCSLGAWTTSADPTPVSATPAHPYWTWPTLAGDTAVWSGFRGSVAIRDCPRRDLAVTADFGVMFARLEGPLFVAVSSGRAARGPFISEVCSDAAPFTLPATLASPGGAPVAIAISRNPGVESSIYLTLDAPSALTLTLDTETDGALSVCATCDAAGAECQTIPVGSTGIRVGGHFYLRWDAPATSWPYAQVVFRATPG